MTDEGKNKNRILIGASGASGFPVLQKCLELVKADGKYRSSLIMSRNARTAAKSEMPEGPDALFELADEVFDPDDIGAGPASGTWKNSGMLIVPCSMKTVAGLHSGFSENLLLRAADVTMKEQRTLVLAPRETPLNPIHLKNMYELSMIPCVRIVPLMISFYHQPRTLDDMITHIAAKLLEPFGIEAEGFRRWKEENV